MFVRVAATRGAIRQHFTCQHSLLRPALLWSSLQHHTSSAFSARFHTSSSVAMSGQPFKKVGTHNGTFHCDEALGCFIIRLTHKYSGAQVLRSRDQTVLDDMDAVLDVGGVFDPERDRFDHHQRGFSETFGRGFVTKLSSAGLVYKYYGPEIIAKELNVDIKHPDVDRVYVALYKSFIEAIDAIDNGINQYDVTDAPRYVDNTNLSARVGKLNVDWIEEQSAEKEDAAFLRAMELTGKEFLEALRYQAKSWLPARTVVANCIASRFEVHDSGEIITLKQFCPWKLHLFELEEEMQLNPPIKYALYEDERSKQWRVQAVAVGPGRFESRKALPIKWRGLRDEELSKEAGIPDCVFVHMSGFIGGNKSYEGALAMAKQALALP